MAYIGSPAAPTIATVSDDTITSAKIADGAVTPSDLSTGHPNWDSSGNVGIGTSSPNRKLTVVTPTATASLNTNAVVFSDFSNATMELRQSTTENQWYSNIAMTLGTNGAERMRIDSSGNVGIGTTVATGQLNVSKSGGNQINVIDSSGSSPGIRFANSSNTALAFIEAPAGNGLSFFSGSTERMRVSEHGFRSGNLNETLGLTSSAYGLALAGNGYASLRVRRGADTGPCVLFYGYASGSSVVGNITVSNTGTSFNSTSDYRLKENVVEVTDGIDRVKLLKPSRFNFIVDPDKTVDGFLAHEVQDVVPEAITGIKDAVDADGNPEYQGIDQSKLVPLLTAALQEAITKIESLEARVATLESA